MNLAALDLGSNSFHLLVARVTSARTLEKVTAAKDVLRLGAVVQTHGELPPAVFRDSLEVIGTMVRIARAHRCERILAVGTSALRDARNGAEFCAAASAKHRISVELLSGVEEGELVHRGAMRSQRDEWERAAVVDIGGGSVELAIGDRSRVSLVESLPLGFLRLSQALLATGSLVNADSIQSAVRERLSGVRERIAAIEPQAWLFSGGTARAVGKLLINPDGLSARAALRVCDDLSSSGRERLRSLGVDESRVDTLPAGALVLRALVQELAIPRLRIVSGGLREGLLLRELGRIEQGSVVRPLPNAAEESSSRLLA